MMEAITEISESHLSTYLPLFVQDIINAKMQTASITRGVSKFMQNISDRVIDCPHLPHIFF